MPKIDILLHGFLFSTDQGLPAFCGVFLIEGEKRILVDPAHVGRRVVLEEALARRGLTPKDIDAVVLTHAHWDHVQNIDLFEHAPLLLHPDERRYSQKPHRHDWATPQWTGVILERQDVREIGDGGTIMPGVTVLEMPGHSPGSIAVMVDTDEGRAAITGDALHFAYVAKTRVNPLVFWDADQATRSIDRVLQAADVLYPGHDRPFRYRNGETEYVADLDITLLNIAADTPGVRFAPNFKREDWVMPGIEEQRLDETLTYPRGRQRWD
jgi:glyoxylase-like metal-dependent hydrolase (beta-lactamase superfamily II)